MLTVAFASFNGADTLPLMLEALTQLEEPKGGWRLVAVDNASTDATLEILTSYLDRLPLTILHQPARGKSRALNLALEHVEGDLLVLTDDDVIPHRNWLSAWRGCANNQLEFGVFGGMIQIHWLEEPPAWIAAAIPLGIAYARTHNDLGPGKVANPLYISGPNMAVRTEAIHNGLRFDETKGPTGANYAMGEDTAFVDAAQKAGYAAAHCPQAMVKHIVQPVQYEKSWLLARIYTYGHVRGMEDVIARRNPDTATWFHVPRWMAREYLKQHVLAAAWWLSGNTEKYMSAAWEARYLAGYLSGYRRQQRKQTLAT